MPLTLALTMPFTFKQFHIDDSHCGMPVSTDGVLLGAWAPLSQAQQILDIGTGSGLLALMAAQRSHGVITAIEIDANAAIDCRRNFAASDWAARLTLINSDIRQWIDSTTSPLPQFDHIICNPPYFEAGPLSQCDRRAQARHTHRLDFAQLLNAIRQLLSSEGNASIILPQASFAGFSAQLAQAQLAIIEQVDVSSVTGKAAHRHLLRLGHLAALSDAKDTNTKSTTQLTIRDKNGAYTPEMVALTQAFYLKL
ncbi:tRNA1(Val) (adenine(37)-N6)-methyltransferase [Shewanella colwelliana]|nr:tRNA1(Val) (adenine(37)-N6)-methyltransferase [Shewanella colwelliana]